MLLACSVLNFGIGIISQWHRYFNCISLMLYDIEHLSICLLYHLYIPPCGCCDKVYLLFELSFIADFLGRSRVMVKWP